MDTNNDCQLSSRSYLHSEILRQDTTQGVGRKEPNKCIVVYTH